METRPARVEVLDPVDRWLHLGAVLATGLALVSGPLLHRPLWLAQWGVDWSAVAALHGAAGAGAALAWGFHLVRVCLGWLEGANPTGLVPRPGDVVGLLHALGWRLYLTSRSPRRERYQYRERAFYAWAMVALPLLCVSGWLLAHPGPSVGLLGASRLPLLAAVHFATGLLCLPALLWHLYFAHLQPGVLYWNGAWLTGKMTWQQVQAVWPQWAESLLHDLQPAADTAAEALSVESLLAAGNAAARDGDWPGAADLYRQAIALYPGYAQALYNLGAVLVRAGELPAAREALTQFLEQDSFGPMAPKARDLLARIDRE